MSLDSLVDELYADPNVQRMLALSTHSEPLQICYPKEVNVSRFLAWLLDPSQGHGLGDQAIKSLLTRAGVSAHQANLTLNCDNYMSARKSSSFKLIDVNKRTLLTRRRVRLVQKRTEMRLADR